MFLSVYPFSGTWKSKKVRKKVNIINENNLHLAIMIENISNCFF